MSNPDDATREDPYGEFGHIKPVDVVVAAAMVRQTTNEQIRANREWAKARGVVAELEKAKKLADKAHEEAMHRLHISALQAE